MTKTLHLIIYGEKHKIQEKCAIIFQCVTLPLELMTTKKKITIDAKHAFQALTVKKIKGPHEKEA